MTGVVISKNVFVGNLDALRVSGGDGPGNVVSATIASNSVIKNRDGGIFVTGSFGDPDDGGNTVKVVIDHNFIRDSQGVVNPGSTGDGIAVVGGSGSSGQGVNGGNKVIAIITNNVSRDNDDDGIFVKGAGGGSAASNHTVFTEVVGNTVTNNGSASGSSANGISFRAGSGSSANPPGSGNTLTFLAANNVSVGSTNQGINVVGGFGDSHTLRGTITGNIVEKSGGTGILVDGQGGNNNTLEDIHILDNKVKRSGADGIRVTGGVGGAGTDLSNITINGNLSVANGGNGINVLLEDANSVSLTGITDNKANRNQGDGIFVGLGVSGSGATPISANEADENTEDGIDLYDTGYVVLANDADDNTVNGINAVGNIDGGGNTATGNALCNTPGCF